MQPAQTAVRAATRTYKDWATGEWVIETSGKEDAMFSPFLKKPFAQAIRVGAIPAHLNTIAGTWGAMHDTGELTYMHLVNLVNLPGCDGTAAAHLRHDDRHPRHTRDRCDQPTGCARAGSASALRPSS